jgi:adenosylcobinamide-GDP ribazoletransferase
VSGLLSAVAFLTRVPVAGRRPQAWSDLGSAVPWFPVVGAAVGLAVGGAFALASAALPALLAAGLSVGLGVVLTGAIHEDGLADSADAFGGGGSREEVLRILRDPRLGTYGVISLVLTAMTRVAALATLGPWTALAALPAIHALARGAAVGAVALLPPATEDGLGAAYAGQVSSRRARLAVVGALLIAGATLGWWSIPSAFLAAAAGFLVGLVALRRIGGVTGDVLGAIEQLVETVLLVLSAAAAVGGIELAWWG